MPGQHPEEHGGEGRDRTQDAFGISGALEVARDEEVVEVSGEVLLWAQQAGAVSRYWHEAHQGPIEEQEERRCEGLSPGPQLQDEERGEEIEIGRASCREGV